MRSMENGGKNLQKKAGHILMLVLALPLVGVLGAVDYLADPYLSFLIFYLVPISFAVWLVGPSGGLFILLASISAWIIDDILSSGSYVHPIVPYWNITLKALFCGAFIFILNALKQALLLAEHLSRIDSLTGAFNRRHFFELAGMEFNRSQRYKHPLSVAYVDIDDFKAVNDSLGHKSGDNLLVSTVRIIKGRIRLNDAIARFGGDEFVLLFPETDYTSAQTAVDRIRKELSLIMRDDGKPVTFSMGVVTCADATGSAEETIRAADSLMYLAKKSGKNKVVHELMK